MNKFLTLCLLLLSITITSVVAQDKTTEDKKLIEKKEEIRKQFVKLMLGKIEQMNKVKNSVELLRFAQDFEAVAKKYPEQWEAEYYAAYCFNLMAYGGRDSVQRDAALDAAQVALDRAKVISKKNVELMLLQTYIYQMTLDISPDTRRKRYEPLIKDFLRKAKELDADNPRLYFLQAQRLFFSSNTKGGGLDDSCPMVQQAIIKYATYESKNELAPIWGESETDYMGGICQEIEDRQAKKDTDKPKNAKVSKKTLKNPYKKSVK